ncbi:pol protein [Cucumis melo var. makuwa]|uniref:Pol protein n=1 Tax=Cucumis melo var. makuwa TaxID=1194695 RepID=A0A5A7SL96_CUCMM|nr:pol protein [Cucumis melo var. makuwa]
MQLAQLTVQPTLWQKIIDAQSNDPYLVKERGLEGAGQAVEFSISFDGGLLFEKRLCVQSDSAVKAPRQKPAGLLQPLSVPEWKWENVSMDFIIGLPRTLRGFIVIWVVVDTLTKSAHFIPGKSTYTATKWAQLYMSEIVRLHGVLVSIVSDRDARFTSKFWKGLQAAMGTSFRATIGMAPFEALYGKFCRSPFSWGEVGEQRLMGPEILSFEVGDKVFLKVAPMKGVLRFERRGKLSPRFVGPFEILEWISPVAYRLALPPSLSKVHDVFHVSMLRKNVPDPSHVVDYEPLEIDENLSYTEQPVEVLAREVKMSRNREIPLVKVLWRNHRVEKATWEREDDMKSRYPEFYSPRNAAHRSHPCSLVGPCQPPTGYPNQSSDHPQPTLSPSLFISATSDASSLLIPCTRRSPEQPRCWGGDIRVQEFYGKRSRNQLSSAWVDSFGRGLERDFSYISGKGFLTTGPLIEARNVVVHMGFLCPIICNELFTDRHRCPDALCNVVMLVGYVVNWYSMSLDYKVLRLCCGVMVSFIYGVVDLTDMCIIRDHLIDMCKGTARGRPTRGKKDV